jgi:very-short-patch-repair endonuclease
MGFLPEAMAAIRVSPVAKQRSRALRGAMTDAECLLWRHLRGRQMDGCRFRRQHPFGKYIVDFVCLEARLIVEVDGGQHAMNEAADRRRTAWLEGQGFRVVRFWNHEVLGEIETVAEAIWQALHVDGQRGDDLDPHPGLPPARGKE